MQLSDTHTHTQELLYTYNRCIFMHSCTHAHCTVVAPEEEDLLWVEDLESE
eukprot:m.111760 g.111760  ORF g.111760 m.111760 type:complete len:51 (+) comp12769_c0_seq1:765-917(+)